MTELPGQAVFECELTKADVKVQWFKNGKPVTASEKCKIFAEGTVHRLVLDGVTGAETGEYSVIARGKSSKAMLTIEG